MEQVANLLVFNLKLGGIRQVLVLATSALTEVTARGCHSLGGGFQEAHQLRAREPLFDFCNLGFDPLPNRRERHKHNELIQSPNALSAERDIGDCDGDSFARGWTHANSLSKGGTR